MPEYVGRKVNFNLAQKLYLSRKLLRSAAGFVSLAVPVAFGVVHAVQIQTEEAAEFKHLKFGVVFYTAEQNQRSLAIRDSDPRWISHAEHVSGGTDPYGVCSAERWGHGLRRRTDCGTSRLAH